MTVQTLELKTSLQLRLTQKMQQAIKLLQMSNQELSTFVAAYIEANPLLEVSDFDDMLEDSDYDDVNSPDTFDTFDESDLALNADEPSLSKEADAFEDTFSPEAHPTQDYENVWQDDFSSLKNAPTYDGTSDYDPFAKLIQEDGLKHYVRAQIDMVMDPCDRELAYILTDLLTDDGYLMEGWEKEIAEFDYSSDAQLQNRERILQKLQTLDPLGVFATSLQECLILQLRDKGLYNETIEKLLVALKNHNGSPSDLAKKLKISLAECNEYLSLLRTLNPKPGANIAKSTIQQVIPDVLMRRRGPDEWVIELNTANLPNVYLNSSYYIELRSMMKGVSDKSFLQEKYIEAKWLLKSLHQRALNIMKVTDYIVRKQAEFFKSSSGRIKPLTLKEVAIEVSLSESTVSRVTTDKYMETPRGLFELKYFFSSGINAEVSSNLHSAKSVQALIARIVQEENKAAPMSDNDIVEHLKLSGIYVARRTVAKYRDVLKIANASERSKYYKWRQKDGKILAIRS